MPSPSTPTPKGNFTIFAFSSSNDLNRFAKKYRTEIAASSSSMLSTFTAFPLDLVKSRMQSYDTSFALTIKDAYKAEGLIAFWRGVLPPLVSVTLVRTFSFSIYQRAKYSFDKAITKATGQSPLAIANAPGSYPNLYTLACFGAAGATSGALITTFSCPFELTKLNQQLAGKMAREANHPGSASRAVDVKQAGSFNTARRLFQERGIKGLYVGYRLHMLRDTIGTAIYFITYESAKQLMANARGKSPTSPYAVVVAGGLCGILTASLIYPVDVAKTVYQKQILGTKPGHVDAPRPSISFFQTGSYRGLGVSVIRSCIINMIFFSNFELVKKQINALDVD
ncbi:mitochondrial carrier protein [Teratosphaeria nubilosa]|uniref:Mitochondrial carrier protein n=1 Tax=Teratosphaeria nubilosa TaxID=161662 RepID=A0A6G1LFB8_9PEZI|nr:mitochondrial carrier protein [Teratosphaeria nubilosa]